MKGFNQVILMGNLARAPELRYTDKKQPFTFFVIAVNYDKKNEDGTYESVADFISCTAWGKGAEVIAKYFHKGSPIHIVGRVKNSRREIERDGVKQTEYRTGITVSQFRFISAGKKEEGTDGTSTSPAKEDIPDIPDSYEIDFDQYGEDYFPEADIPF